MDRMSSRDDHLTAVVPGTSLQRLPSLDGLRGLAALVVVFHHCFLTDTTFSDPFLGLTDSYAPSAGWWITYTPLHLLWAGPEAVTVFFILSGFVLVRLAKRHGFRWLPYYPSRLLRLYLPMWAALLIAIGIESAAVPRVLHGWNWWLNGHTLANPTLSAVLHNAIIYNPNSWLLTPLWSLKWEVVFSNLLPLAVILGTRFRSLALGELCLAFAVIAIGSQTNELAAIYLPMFVIGALIAHHETAIAAQARRFTGPAWLLLGVTAVFLITSSWTFHQPTNPSFTPIETVGAALIVIAFAFCPQAKHFAERRTIQRLGKLSFSLYLVHEPIVVATAYALPPSSRNVWLPFLIAFPTVLAASWIFFRCVEAPSHRLARRIAGGRSASLSSPRLEPSR